MRPIAFHLEHLTKLQRLEIDADGVAIACHSPPQLQHLEFRCFGPAVPALNATYLSCLQRLSVHRSEEDYWQLLVLQQMQQLQKLALSYRELEHASAAATAWPKLQLLVNLQFEVGCASTQMDQLAALIDTLSGLTKLTRLSICAFLEDVDSDDSDDLNQNAYESAPQQLRNICQGVKHLTLFKELELDLTNWLVFGKGDLAHLSNLTKLTTLLLDCGPDVFEDTKGIEAWLVLTRLKNFSLHCAGQLSMLPTIGRLLSLTHLQLYGLSQQQQSEGLNHLSGARKLQFIYGFEKCDREVLNNFWSNLRS